MLRQLRQFLIEDWQQVVGPIARFGGGRTPRGHGLLLRNPTEAVGPGAPGDPVGDPVEPRPDLLARADQLRLADQDQERGLEGVLGQVRVADHPATHPEHGRTESPHERPQRSLVALLDEPRE